MLDVMDPLTVAVALLTAWGLTKMLGANAPTGFPIIIPPSGPYPAPPSNLPPPTDCAAMTAPFPKDISPWGYKQLHYSFGTTIVDMVDDVLVVARIENHYHPPGMTGVTATGWHKGCTVYRPKLPWVEVPPPADNA